MNRIRLSFAELETLARLRTARLLALDGARVSSEKAEIAELASVCLVDLDERSGHRETQRAGLSRGAAAIDVGLHIVSPERVRCREWLLDRRHECGTREVIA